MGAGRIALVNSPRTRMIDGVVLLRARADAVQVLFLRFDTAGRVRVNKLVAEDFVDCRPIARDNSLRPRFLGVADLGLWVGGVQSAYRDQGDQCNRGSFHIVPRSVIIPNVRRKPGWIRPSRILEF